MVFYGFLPTKITFPQEGTERVGCNLWVPFSESINPLSGAVTGILKDEHFSPIASLSVVARIPNLNKQLSPGCRLCVFLWDGSRSRQAVPDSHKDHSVEDSVSEQGQHLPYPL